VTLEIFLIVNAVVRIDAQFLIDRPALFEEIVQLVLLGVDNANPQSFECDQNLSVLLMHLFVLNLHSALCFQTMMLFMMTSRGRLEKQVEFPFLKIR